MLQLIFVVFVLIPYSRIGFFFLIKQLKYEKNIKK